MNLWLLAFLKKGCDAYEIILYSIYLKPYFVSYLIFNAQEGTTMQSNNAFFVSNMFNKYWKQTK